jgi:hypothetical protein
VKRLYIPRRLLSFLAADSLRNSVRRAPSNPGTGISDIKRTTKRTATVKMILCWSSGILKQFKVVVKTPLMRLIMKLN